jgi:drug/metabolite transporter (DMT)-like permease
MSLSESVASEVKLQTPLLLGSRMQNESVGRGVGLSLLAMLCLAGMDATGKVLTQTYPIVQVLAIRFAIFLCVVCLVSLVTARKGPRQPFRSRMVGTQILRSLVLVVEVSVFILAFSMMPLADVHAIAAISPLIVTLMAGLFLGERIGLRSWLSVGAGFAGALIIIRPGMHVMSGTAMIPVIGAVLWAAYQILSRRVAEVDSPETSVFFSAAIGFIVFGSLAPFYWIWPSAESWLFLIMNGLLGTTGHYVLIKALALAPASILQPFSYTLMVWAIVIGYVVFGDLPDGFTLLGAAIVVAAGVYLSEAGRSLLLRSKPA